ncbi:Phosphoglucomutase [Hibiscus syriacus]|uniref:phosphoglucomutase (alpha-D-glucose-1,6-bisphosphate-dependent) n=1 Tax=Hibiscus syriacus TaxID=106335 RepID=A0A6A2Y563_HIBSY|nr:Phosphoglucomutase [Hibiscus syriacus]
MPFVFENGIIVFGIQIEECNCNSGRHFAVTPPSETDIRKNHAVIRERVGADASNIVPMFNHKILFHGSKATGSFILTASHNPGSPHEDFGIKYNMENGGPAPEAITDKIFENTKTISEYLTADDLPNTSVQLVLQALRGLKDNLMLRSTFDFDLIRRLLSSPKFTFCYDALHGIAGAYANRIFVEELGAQESSLLNCVPKEDFGGGHPDPNLTYAKELVARMGLSKSNSEVKPSEFGAAADGDADRNRSWEKDSVAIIAANAVDAIPYFSSGLKGVARSIPTSAALDVVAKHLNLKFFEVLTIYPRRMEFGPFWLGFQYLHIKIRIISMEINSVTVEDIVRQHWATYGRHYYTRYDHEEFTGRLAPTVIT